MKLNLVKKMIFGQRYCGRYSVNRVENQSSRKFSVPGTGFSGGFSRTYPRDDWDRQASEILAFEQKIRGFPTTIEFFDGVVVLRWGW